MPNDLTTDLARFLEDLYRGSLRSASGALATPAYAFNADPDTGMRLEAADDLRFTVGGVDALRFATSAFMVLPAGGALQWGSSGVGTPDVSLTRPAANRLMLAVGDVFNLAPTAFASLPTGAEGDIAFVTDSSTATPGATVAGGGANNVQVFFNGTNWICS